MLKENDQPRRYWTTAHWTRRGLAAAFVGGLALGSVATALVSTRHHDTTTVLATTASAASAVEADAAPLTTIAAAAAPSGASAPATSATAAPLTTIAAVTPPSTTAPAVLVPAPAGPLPQPAPGPVGTPPTADVAARCSRPETPLAPAPQTLEAFRQTIVHRWLLCAHPSVFGTNDEAGLDVLPDGTWFKLTVAADGSLQRAGGFGQQGTWDIIDTSAMNGKPTFQLNLNIFGSGTVIVTPQFAGDPLKVRLNNMGLFVGDYVTA
jgi:hypothetical protein